MIDRRALLALPAGALLLPARAQTPPLRLGTSTAGGGFALYGEVLQRVLQAGSGRPVVVARPTRGTDENLGMLDRGELDLALIQGTTATELLQRPADAGLRVVYAMYPSAGLMAVPAASPAQRLDELRGQPVVWGVRTSGLVLLARQVYAGLGLDIDRDFQPLYVAQAADGPPLVFSGQAAGLWGAGEGWPSFLRLASAPGGARFLGPTAEQAQRIVAAYPFLKAMTLPADTYRGMAAPLPTVGSWNVVMARADFPADAVHAFARAMHDAAAALAAALPQAAASTAPATLEAASRPALLHPGTLRLLRELRLAD